MKILLIIIFLFVNNIFAQKTDTSIKDFALSTSGGVSLGSYQAGQLYYQSLFLNENKHFVTPSIVTGASAGAINSFISILNKCSDISSRPDQSILWDTWKSIGLKNLTPSKDDKGSISLFSTRSLDETAKKLQEIWFRGFRKGCTTTFGIPVTFKEPDSLRIKNSITIQRQSAPVILKITGNGFGRAPSIENFIIKGSKNLQVEIYLKGDDLSNFKEVVNVLFASSAFPLAFSPRKVRICKQDTNCSFINTVVKEFVDGGIYQNQPLALAYLIAEEKGINHNIFYRHVDTDGKVYPAKVSPILGHKSFIYNTIELVEKFVTTSRNMELYNLMVYNPGVIDSISNSTSFYPRASDPWAAFFGFLDINFREFDFLLGIYESKREITELLPLIRKGQEGDYVRLPVLEASEERASRATLNRFNCLSHFLNNKIDKTCDTKDYDNLRILAQVSLLRLHRNCTQDGIDKKKWKGCQALDVFDKGPPFISEKYSLLDILPEDEEDDGLYMFRALERMNFKFDPNNYVENEQIKTQVRSKFKKIATRLAKQQNNDEKSLILKSSKLILDLLDYESPNSTAYLQFGELGVIGGQYRLYNNLPWLKIDFGLDSFRVSDFISNVGNETTFAPFVGVAYDLSFFNSPVFQYQVGLSYSKNYPKDTTQCNAVAFFKDNIICKGQVIRTSFNLIYRDIIKASYVGRKSVSGVTNNRFDSQFVVGFQFEI